MLIDNYRLLSSLHGPPESDLPHLRPTDQPRLRSNLPWTASHFRDSDRRLLAHSAGAPRNGRAIAGRSWRLWLPCNFGRLVDLLCSNARSVDFPFQLPVGDISHLITPLSERVKQKERYPA